MPLVIIQIMCNNLFEHVRVIAIPDSVTAYKWRPVLTGDAI